jgi:predicted ATPase
MPPFIRQVTLRSYKSIAACKVDLGPLMFLVGKNGAGKSNFLDAIGFIADALRISLDYALRGRGTIKEVRRRSAGHPNHFAIRVNFTLPDGRDGHYAFRIGAKPNEGYEVQTEECFIHFAEAIGNTEHFQVQSGRVMTSTVSPLPAVTADRLFLVAASGLPQFRPVYDALSRIEIYNLNPKEIAAMQKPDPGNILRHDGSNIASVFQQFTPKIQQLVKDNLSRIVPSISDIDVQPFGQLEAMKFKQKIKGQSNPWQFFATAMSDGTLRAFGILVAAFQAASAKPGSNPPLLIGLEEPEMALHPAAAGTLLSVLRQGAENCQILVTSHSPDLLDNRDISPDALLAVTDDGGLTKIGPIDTASRQTLRDGLCTAGELLRQDQLVPASDSVSDVASERQLKLFGL